MRSSKYPACGKCRPVRVSKWRKGKPVDWEYEPCSDCDPTRRSPHDPLPPVFPPGKGPKKENPRPERPHKWTQRIQAKARLSRMRSKRSAFEGADLSKVKAIELEWVRDPRTVFIIHKAVRGDNVWKGVVYPWQVSRFERQEDGELVARGHSIVLSLKDGVEKLAREYGEVRRTRLANPPKDATALRILAWIDSHGDPIRLFRELVIPAGGKIDETKLGRFWTPVQAKAVSPFGRSDHGAGTKVLVTALARRADVDEAETIATMRRYPTEMEIRLKEGASVQVVNIEEKKANPPKDPLEVLVAECRAMGATKIDFSRSGPYLVLSRLVVDARGQGTGTKIMQRIVSWADQHNVPMALTASTDFGGSSKKRLEEFYARFGFVKNAGRNKDFTTREGMLRMPRRTNPLPGKTLRSEEAMDGISDVADYVGRDVWETLKKKHGLRAFLGGGGSASVFLGNRGLAYKFTRDPSDAMASFERMKHPEADGVLARVLDVKQIKSIRDGTHVFMIVSEALHPLPKAWGVDYNAELTGKDTARKAALVKNTRIRQVVKERHDSAVEAMNKLGGTQIDNQDQNWGLRAKGDISSAVLLDFGMSGVKGTPQVPFDNPPRRNPSPVRDQATRSLAKEAFAEYVRLLEALPSHRHPASPYYLHGYVESPRWPGLTVHFTNYKPGDKSGSFSISTGPHLSVFDVPTKGSRLAPDRDRFDTFLHEFVHYLDWARWKGDKRTTMAGQGRGASYYLSPMEFNAYYQQGIENYARALLRDAEILRDAAPGEDYDYFKGEMDRHLSRKGFLRSYDIYWDRGFIDYVQKDEDMKRRFLKRAMGDFEALKEQVAVILSKRAANPGYEGLAYLLGQKGKVSQIGPERGPSPINGIAVWKSPFGSFRYVAIEGGRVVSAIQIMSRDGKAGVVANAFTAPDARRKGYGRRLVEQAKLDFERLDFGDDRSDDGRPFVEAVKNPPATSREHFLAEFRALWDRSPLAGQSYTVEFTEALKKTHEQNRRRYAECEPARRAFFFAPQTLLLSQRHRLGLIAHEIGHALHGAQPHSEKDADRAAFEGTGVQIGYDRHWPGKGLQVKVNPVSENPRKWTADQVRLLDAKANTNRPLERVSLLAYALGMKPERVKTIIDQILKRGDRLLLVDAASPDWLVEMTPEARALWTNWLRYGKTPPAPPTATNPLTGVEANAMILHGQANLREAQRTSSPTRAAYEAGKARARGAAVAQHGPLVMQPVGRELSIAGREMGKLASRVKPNPENRYLRYVYAVLKPGVKRRASRRASDYEQQEVPVSLVQASTSLTPEVLARAAQAESFLQPLTFDDLSPESVASLFAGVERKEIDISGGRYTRIPTNWKLSESFRRKGQKKPNPNYVEDILASRGEYSMADWDSQAPLAPSDMRVLGALGHHEIVFDLRGLVGETGHAESTVRQALKKLHKKGFVVPKDGGVVITSLGGEALVALVALNALAQQHEGESYSDRDFERWETQAIRSRGGTVGRRPMTLGPRGQRARTVVDTHPAAPRGRCTTCRVPHSLRDHRHHRVEGKEYKVDLLGQRFENPRSRPARGQPEYWGYDQCETCGRDFRFDTRRGVQTLCAPCRQAASEHGRNQKAQRAHAAKATREEQVAMERALNKQAVPGQPCGRCGGATHWDGFDQRVTHDVPPADGHLVIPGVA